MLIEADRSNLLLIDLQTKLAPAVDEPDRCINGCQMLLAAARRLGVPVSATEHCSAKVGPTVPALRERLDTSEIIEKRHFNGALEPLLSDRLASSDRPTAIIGGMEAHVCVMQTALGLKMAGYEPAIVADAIASRDPASRDLAIARMRAHGLEIVSVEMVLFEWLKVADTQAFSDLLPMIKNASLN